MAEKARSNVAVETGEEQGIGIPCFSQNNTISLNRLLQPSGFHVAYQQDNPKFINRTGCEIESSTCLLRCEREGQQSKKEWACSSLGSISMCQDFLYTHIQCPIQIKH
uniref:Uncharacterized protein n=1 Tax=Arundo donax TaxID=35708 RepID=A0A0A9BDT3_ARUDO